MWAFIPIERFKNNAVMTIASQVPADYTIYVVAPDVPDQAGIVDIDITTAKTLLEEAFKTRPSLKGQKFNPNDVAVWHVRNLYENGLFISDNRWEKGGPNYCGPADTTLFAYCHKLAEEEREEKRRLENEAFAKKKAAAYAAEQAAKAAAAASS